MGGTQPPVLPALPYRDCLWKAHGIVDMFYTLSEVAGVTKRLVFPWCDGAVWSDALGHPSCVGRERTAAFGLQ